jgi:hypothetical protein
MGDVIGLIGVPRREVIESYKLKGEIIDLDMPISGVEYTSKYDDIFPKPYCAILRTIFYNALELRPSVIIIDGGMGKCDGAHYLVEVLKRLLPRLEVNAEPNYSLNGEGIALCDNYELPLIERMDIICKGVVNRELKKKYKAIPHIKPKVAFWGVPPKDFGILELFPKETRILGWARCMENHTPHNYELELFVDESLPTVFFAQSFCQKNILAKYLANKYNGLYVDVDLKPDRSILSQIEAFIELRTSS